MSRIVFAWELGDNFGHLLRMAPIAEEMIRRGHRVTFVLNHMAGAQAVLAAKGIAFLPAPSCQGQIELGREIASYADILAVNGFAQPAAFDGMMRAWANLHALLETDVVVVEHAPAALIAARMLNLKTGAHRHWVHHPAAHFADAVFSSMAGRNCGRARSHGAERAVRHQCRAFIAQASGRGDLERCAGD